MIRIYAGIGGMRINESFQLTSVKLEEFAAKNEYDDIHSESIDSNESDNSQF